MPENFEKSSGILGREILLDEVPENDSQFHGIL